MDQEEALEFAQHLTDVSRSIALRYFRTSLDIRWKEDASPVTIADCRIESTLRSVIRDRYPDHGIIGEEYDCAPGGRYSWILDPIDLVENNLEPCDYLPLVPIIDGAGGRITDWTGKPLTLNSDGRVIAASTERLLAAAIEVLHHALAAADSVTG
jgi:fructose-1,6-bisphosphatase/inositol monophosphatase family enzyme